MFGDRRSRTILAIMAARRSSGREVFFVPPQIANLYGLTPRDLCWALDDLEGRVTVTVGSKQGKFRQVRLADRWEKLLSAMHRASRRTSGASPKRKASSTNKSSQPKQESAHPATPLLDDPVFQKNILAAVHARCNDATTNGSPSRAQPQSFILAHTASKSPSLEHFVGADTKTTKTWQTTI
jgi:hypothetical protein